MRGYGTYLGETITVTKQITFETFRVLRIKSFKTEVLHETLINQPYMNFVTANLFTLIRAHFCTSKGEKSTMG